METLRKKFADRDVEFLLVYVREAHPQEPGYRWVRTPKTFEEKRDYACRLVADRGMKVAVLVDGLDEAVHREFGSLPNIVYVVDKDGRIVYKATWTRASRLEEVLTALTAAASG